jgi:hypothetical protein
MAQTKKKRRTKHRGNAAGMVESRGRTGRKPGAGEASKASVKADARQRRMDRLDREPTWRSAANRAIIATIFFAVLVVLLFDRPVTEAVMLATFMLVLYVPLTYYTDLFIYRRRQRKKAAAGSRA